MREIQSIEEAQALPDGSLLWYHITWDSTEIHQILQKHGNWWRNANDPDDGNEYTPAIPCILLREGWHDEH